MDDKTYTGHTFWYCGYRVQTAFNDELEIWCGYVYIPDGHWYHGQPCDDIDLQVHGGLTYTQQEGSEWKIGFDCSHFGDKTKFWQEGTFRTEGYVIDELKQMVDQIVKLD